MSLMTTFLPSPAGRRASGEIHSAGLAYSVESEPPEYWNVMPTGWRKGFVASYWCTRSIMWYCQEVEYGPASFAIS